jgi:hypothetical protein
MYLPETIEFVRLYYAIPDHEMRHRFLDMVKAVAGAAKSKSQVVG